MNKPKTEKDLFSRREKMPTEIKYDEITECTACHHDLREYCDKEEWVCCPFCGYQVKNNYDK